MKPLVWIYWRWWAIWNFHCPRHFIELEAFYDSLSCPICDEEARLTYQEKKEAKLAWFKRRLS